MLVQELMQHTMMESLKSTKQGLKKEQKHLMSEREGMNRVLLVDIIVVGVVAAQCDERAQAQTVGEEDLCRCIQPHLSNSTHIHIHASYFLISTYFLVRQV